ncbi:B3 domain-containing protein os06g0194400 [Phtheirospermum japonicum]|uniref:B3 domain-containing protein os06g0194400 n=1 Tax=Phtheirospermum japonicum TaxID=374723 RepID=A0A830C1X4_9LAMI|nr:B3 domain-containing protein os06g0194400 [Phtheirospermum japonicum]
MERAQEIQHKLSPNSPSFLKNMLKSHVTGGFWLGLPKQFCVDHLPECDEKVVLVGENEVEHDTKYLVDKNGLSGGWRGFSIAHKLVEGDVLVFELLKPCKFKVILSLLCIFFLFYLCFYFVGEVNSTILALNCLKSDHS